MKAASERTTPPLLKVHLIVNKISGWGCSSAQGPRSNPSARKRDEGGRERGEGETDRKEGPEGRVEDLVFLISHETSESDSPSVNLSLFF
jgi:hypothetical protein